MKGVKPSNKMPFHLQLYVLRQGSRSQGLQKAVVRDTRTFKNVEACSAKGKENQIKNILFYPSIESHQSEFEFIFCSTSHCEKREESLDIYCGPVFVTSSTRTYSVGRSKKFP